MTQNVTDRMILKCGDVFRSASPVSSPFGIHSECFAKARLLTFRWAYLDESPRPHLAK